MNTLPFRGRNVLITGASRGIGLAMARAYGAAGATVLMMGRELEALARGADSIQRAGGRAWHHGLDVTDDASVARAVDAARAAHGHIDLLINNAGVYFQQPFLEQDPARGRLELEVNYFGALRMVRAVLPEMLQRGEGTLVNVSSVLGQVAYPTNANYSASKAALNAFTHALRGEVEARGVRVLLFMPGHTRTENGLSVKLTRVPLQDPEEVAREAVRATLRARPVHVSGAGNRTFVWLSGLFPNWARNYMREVARVSFATPALPPERS
ncbi:SDR family NAD(P)-dependent oxidoreductase [Archangium lipolyticum]|uniref:SDR family NAD(P)-dependent oxidoreductase n=1 Tax=Archangium lipolyticum TaxID=2970465 RepID=UPI002149AC1F|nr:SDR family oxidoreductase [Archangium lipolyticum]